VKRVENLIYDVGMHNGEDTDFYLKKEFRVVAFEANPELVQQNQNRFSEYIKEGKLTIVAGAIVENVVSEKVQFYRNLDRTEWGTVNAGRASRNEMKRKEQEIE